MLRYWHKLQFYIASVEAHWIRGKKKPFSQCAKWFLPLLHYEMVHTWGPCHYGSVNSFTAQNLASFVKHQAALSLAENWKVMVHNVKLTKVHSCCSYSQKVWCNNDVMEKSWNLLHVPDSQPIQSLQSMEVDRMHRKHYGNITTGSEFN